MLWQDQLESCKNIKLTTQRACDWLITKISGVALESMNISFACEGRGSPNQSYLVNDPDEKKKRGLEWYAEKLDNLPELYKDKGHAVILAKAQVQHILGLYGFYEGDLALAKKSFLEEKSLLQPIWGQELKKDINYTNGPKNMMRLDLNKLTQRMLYNASETAQMLHNNDSNTEALEEYKWASEIFDTNGYAHDKGSGIDGLWQREKELKQQHQQHQQQQQQQQQQHQQQQHTNIHTNKIT